MKSVSYIILLMSLIGNCQSAKAFCAQNKTDFCSEERIAKLSNEEAMQLLKDFSCFISKYQKSFQNQLAFDNAKQDFEFQQFSIDIPPQNNNGYLFKIQHKTSKVRNKDHLLS